MDNQGKTLAARAFAETFAEALSGSLEQSTGAPWPLEVLNCPDPPTSKGKPVHFRLRVDGTLSGECFVEFYEPQIAALAATIVKEPEETSPDRQADVVAKALSTAMTGLTESLATMYGPLTIRVDRVAGLAFGGLLVVALGTADSTPVLLYFGGQLLENLSKLSEAGQADETEEPLVYPHNLKIVMDVELNVSLLFGRRQLPLREVLGLASGSVIELDRMVDEPVELLLDGKVIARGEAVIIDGNYGLRVTEIPQPVASHFLN